MDSTIELFANANETAEEMLSTIAASGNFTSTVATGNGASISQLWEVLLITACPVLFILFLCCCVVCLVLRNWDELPESTPRRNTLNVNARPLAAPPSYDIAWSTAHIPPPLYEDIEKGIDTSLPPPTYRAAECSHIDVIRVTTVKE